MDIGRAFTYMFDDERWITKILIGGLFVLASFVLVGIPFVVGYMIETVRNVMRGVERPLPEWTNLGDKFRDGLILSIIFIIWLIPSWILACFQAVFTSALQNNANAGAGISFLSFCVGCLNFLWAIVVSVAAPAIFVRFAERPEFASGFNFQAIWDFTRDNIGNIIIAVLLSWVAGFIASFGVILCIIGVLFTYFWALLVQSFLYGQVYLHRKGSAPAPVVTP